MEILQSRNCKIHSLCFHDESQCRTNNNKGEFVTQKAAALEAIHLMWLNWKVEAKCCLQVNILIHVCTGARLVYCRNHVLFFSEMKRRKGCSKKNLFQCPYGQLTVDLREIVKLSFTLKGDYSITLVAAKIWNCRWVVSFTMSDGSNLQPCGW